MVVSSSQDGEARQAARIVGREAEYFPFTGKQYEYVIAWAGVLNERATCFAAECEINREQEEQERPGDCAALFSTWPCPAVCC